MLMLIWIFTQWTILLQYIIAAPDSTVPHFGEQVPLILSDEDESPRGSHLTMNEGLMEAIKSPPFISAISAFIISIVCFPNISYPFCLDDQQYNPIACI